eukprot:TRINITY_DN9025_c0_g1_i2.p1 TRINITY_DN9025_c0_g1~~TRINITY_DN9025_c0_g1_i2.p1  ORF type:complete len:182 (-),score=27.32 TRINITY_DN9025_c0_g1_i2:54-599(-)
MAHTHQAHEHHGGCPSCEDDQKHTKYALLSEFGDLDLSEYPGIDLAFVDEAKLDDFYVYLKPQYGLYFRTELKFHVVVPVGYPQKAPKVTADTLIYHPNINRTDGDVPLSSWWGKEEGFRGMRRLLAYLIVILQSPDVLHPVNFPATLLVDKDVNQFAKNVELSLKGGVVDGVQYPRLLPE